MYPARTRWYWAALTLLALAAAAYAQKRDIYALRLDYRASEDEVRMLERELETSSESEAELKQRVSQLHDDPLEMEAAIRDTKRLVRDGETIYRVNVPEPVRTENAQAVP